MSEFDQIESGREPSKQDEALAALEEQLAAERDGRKEDRFVFLLFGFIFFDAWVFQGFKSWGSGTSLVVLELLLLLVVARRLGVDDIARWIDRVLSSVSSGSSKRDEKD